MIHRKIKRDSHAEPGAEALEDRKIQRIKKVAIVVAFISTYYFFIKLLFM